MLSKNNFKEKIRKMEAKKQHYSIRKFSVGVASVLIGFSFMTYSKTAKADVVNSTPAVAVNNSKNTEQTSDSKADSTADKNKSAEADSTASVSSQAVSNSSSSLTSSATSHAANKSTATSSTSALPQSHASGSPVASSSSAANQNGGGRKGN